MATHATLRLIAPIPGARLEAYTLSDAPISERTSRGSVIAAILIVAGGAGWFALSHFGMHNPIGDAAGEALGVMLALLVVASIIGAVRSGRS